ncbi:hypothetical protein K1719_043406 [Acacia pycnantha]|nr:hypothetical protein K1719_043406 [Acacia pycnantha]
MPIRYSYRDIKKMTKGLKWNLGKEVMALFSKDNFEVVVTWPSRCWTRLTPMVSDFGLAKLYKNYSIVSLTAARGTTGYMAPDSSIRICTTKEEMKLARKMMIVGLWCIQTKPSDRPSMNKVVEMLEGDEQDLELPQKPYLYPQDLPAIDDYNHSTSRPRSKSSSQPAMSKYVEMLEGEEQELVLPHKPFLRAQDSPTIDKVLAITYLGAMSYFLEMEKLSKNDAAEKTEEGTYRSLIGHLMSLTTTRPNINYVARALSRFMHYATGSEKPEVVAQSIAEAEFIAANAAVKQALWLRKMLIDLQFMQ